MCKYKTKAYFLFNFWDFLLNFLGFNVYSRCWQPLEKDEPALSLFVLGLEKTTVSELVFNGSFSERC